VLHLSREGGDVARDGGVWVVFVSPPRPSVIFSLAAGVVAGKEGGREGMGVGGHLLWSCGGAVGFVGARCTDLTLGGFACLSIIFVGDRDCS